MKVIVITGSTRGIGLGLARSFLAHESCVVVSGRAAAGVQAAARDLQASFDRERILGAPCDVRRPEQLQALWDQAVERFGEVDIWINNAGIATTICKAWDVAPDQMAEIVDTNVLGSMYGARVAINGMLAQGHGALYNMEGMGSNGRKQDGLAIYGTSKAAIRYLTEALVLETKDTPLIVGSISPGMITTSLVIDQFKEDPELWQRSKRALGIIMDDVETVTPWLAQKVLQNNKHGVRIAWLTRRKLAGRFLAAPLNLRPELGDLSDYA